MYVNLLAQNTEVEIPNLKNQKTKEFSRENLSISLAAQSDAKCDYFRWFSNSVFCVSRRSKAFTINPPTLLEELLTLFRFNFQGKRYF